MMCELLFDVPAGALLLVDEPEMSLHLMWQQPYIGDLIQCATLGDYQAFVATHSPDIAQGWDDLLRSLDNDGDTDGSSTVPNT